MANTTPLRIALLGSGNSARTFHGPYILALPKLWSLYAVYERGATAEKSKARDVFGSDIKVYSSLEETLADPKVDVTCVCAASVVHFEYAKKSLLAGKHVIVEKPFTTTAAEAKELAQIAKDKGLYLLPFQNRRYDSDFLTLVKLLQNGTIPEVIDFESRYDCNVRWNLGPPGVGQGIVPGLGSHTIDQAVKLFGKPSTVYADCWNARGLGHPDTVDSCNITLRYPDSARRVFIRIATFSTLEKQQRFFVRGKDVSFIKYQMDPQEEQIMSGMKVTDPGFGIEPQGYWGTLSRLAPSDPLHPSPYLSASSEIVESERGNYVGFYENAARAIRGEVEQEIKPEDAVLTITIMEAVDLSSREGRIVKL